MRAIAAFTLGFLVACGAAQPPVDWDKKLQKENEITALWTQIRDWRREGHMDLDPAATFLIEVRGRPVRDVMRVCRADHAVPESCNAICDLGTAICDNAEAICQIAEELGKGDEYAQDKCTSAKGSCREAQKKCCNCSTTAEVK